MSPMEACGGRVFAILCGVGCLGGIAILGFKRRLSMDGPFVFAGAGFVAEDLWGSRQLPLDFPHADGPFVLRDFITEVADGTAGLREPLLFGLTKEGEREQLERRRKAEIGYGRVCMPAAQGSGVPEYVKLPGYLAPPMDLQFADVPNGV